MFVVLQRSSSADPDEIAHLNDFVWIYACYNIDTMILALKRLIYNI